MAQEEILKETPQEFASKIKTKYPQYKDMDDIELAQKIVAKYPEYKSQVDFSEKKNSDSTATDPELASGTPDGSLDTQEFDVSQLSSDRLKDKIVEVKPVEKEDKTSPVIIPQEGAKIFDEKDEIEQTRKRFKNLPDAVLKFGAARDRAISSISRVPLYLLEQVATAGLSQDQKDELNNLSLEDREDVLIDLASKTTGFGLLGQTSKLGREQYNEFRENTQLLDDAMTKYETSIAKDFGDLDLGQATFRVFNEVVGAIPSFIQAAVPYVGLASLGIGSAAAESGESQEQGMGLSLKTSANAAVYGIAEAALETVSRGIAKNFLKSLWDKPKKVGLNHLKTLVTSFVKNSGAEGISETGTTLLQKLSDQYIKGNKKAFEGTLEEFLDTFIIGAASGGALGTSGKAIQVMKSVSTERSVNRELGDLEWGDNTSADEISAVKNTQENETFVESKLASDKYSNWNEIKNQLKAIPEGFSTDEEVEAVDLLRKRSKLEKSIESKDPSLIKKEKESIEKINTELENIREPETKETAVKEEKAKVETATPQEEANKISVDKNQDAFANLKTGEVIDTQVKTGQQNTEFFTGKAAEASSKIPYKPVIDIDQNTPTAKSYKKFSSEGNFTGHISKMIAGFAEKQVKVAEAIAKGGFKRFLDIGTSEGGMIKTVADNNKNIKAVGIDPNSQMKENFEKTPKVKNAEFRQEALGASWVDADGTVINEFKPKEKFDVVNEDFAFQFINNDREGQVKSVKEMMTPDGVFVTSEKFHTANEAANEQKKLDHQRQYFDESQLTEDKQTIINGMADDMVNDKAYEKVLKDNFKFVEEFWNSGNFKGYIASDSQAKLNEFKENVGDLTSEFTEGKKDINALRKIFENEGSKKLEAQVENARKSLAKIAPDVKISITYGARKENRLGGIWNPVDRTIIINGNNATGTTVAHEVFHAVLATKIGSDKKIQAITRKMLDSIYAGLDADTKSKIDIFKARYPKGVQSEEALAELTGILANHYTNANKKTKSLIRKWLNDIARALNLNSVKDSEALNLLNTIASKVSGGKVITEGDVKSLKKDDGSLSKRDQKQAVDIYSNNESLDKANSIDVAKMLNNFAKSVIGPKSGKTTLTKRFLENIYEEVHHALTSKENARESGVTWYHEDMVEFSNKIKTIFKELKDPLQHKLFLNILAITSSGTNPNQNLAFTYNLWKNSESPKDFKFSKDWGESKLSFISKKGKSIGSGTITRETKHRIYFQEVDAFGNLVVDQKGNPKIKTILKSDLKLGYPKPTGYTNRGNIVKKQLGKLEALHKELGSLEAVVKWLETPQTIQELRKYHKAVPDVNGKMPLTDPSKNAEGKRHGAFIFGEKIGSFYQNMIGINEHITMDLWWSRTWNRYMGTMISDVKGKEGIQEKPRSDQERLIMREAVDIASKELGLEVNELQAVIWYFEQQLWSQAGNFSPSFSYVTAVNELNKKIKTNEQQNKEFQRSEVDLREANKRAKDAESRAGGIISGKRQQKTDNLKEIIALAKEKGFSKEVTSEFLKEKGFDQNIVDIAVTKGFAESVARKSKGKEAQPAVGLVAGVNAIRVAYNKGAANKKKAIQSAKADAVKLIFKELKTRVNTIQLKSLMSRVRDITDSNFDKVMTQIDNVIAKANNTSEERAYRSRVGKGIKQVRKRNRKGEYDKKDITGLRTMISKITSLDPSQIPNELREEYEGVLSSMLNYKRRNIQPHFDLVSDLNDKLDDTYNNRDFAEALKAQIELESLEERTEQKELKEEEQHAIYKDIIKDLLRVGYDKNAFNDFDRGQLFKLHKFLNEANLNEFNSKKLKEIAQQLQQTKKGSNAWMPVQTVTKLVAEFEADRVTKGMENEVDFHRQTKSLFSGLVKFSKSVGKTRKGIDAEVKGFDRTMKGYMSSFSGLFKKSEFSYGNTIGLYVAGTATMDNQKSQFSRKFEGLLKKVKGNDWKNQIKLMLYAIEHRAQANINNPNVFTAKQHIDATKEANEVNLADVKDLETEVKKWEDKNGEIDLSKIEKSLTKAERDLVDLIVREQSYANERRKQTSRHYEGSTAEDIDWYTPIVVEGKAGSKLSESFNFTTRKSEPAAGGANQNLKANSASPISLDYFSNIKNHIDTSIEYATMMPVFKQLEATEKAMLKSENKSVREWKRAVFGEDLKENKGIIRRQVEEANIQKSRNTELNKFLGTVANNLLKSMLVSSTRFVVDTGINQILSKGLFGPEMIRGKINRKKYNTGGKVKTDDWMSEMFTSYNSEQAGRILGQHTTDGKTVQKGLEQKSSYKTNNRTVFQAINDIFRYNVINRATDKSLEMYYKGSDQPAMEIWRAAFSKSFPTFDIGAFTGKNKLDYREENDIAIKKAIAEADKMTRILFNTPSSAAEKLTTTRAKKGGFLEQGSQLLLGFKYNEYHALREAITSLMPSFISPKGQLNTGDAMKVAFTISSRAIVYTAAQAMMTAAIVSALSGEGDEEEEAREAKIVERSLWQFGSFLFLGNKNAYVTGAAEYVFDKFRESAQEEGEKYDNVFYSNKPDLGYLGMLALMVENMEAIGAYSWEKIYMQNILEKEVEDEARDKMMTNKALTAIIAVSTGVKTKIFEKVAKRAIENE